jgi:hypothetical protein
MNYWLEQGATYRVTVKCTPIERAFFTWSFLLKMLRQSGLIGASYRVEKRAIVIDGQYVGPTGQATVPDRVTEVVRL